MTTKIVGLILAGAILVSWLFWRIDNFASTPNSAPHEKMIFEVRPDMTLYQAAILLKKDDLVTSAKKFIWYAKLTNDAGLIKIGEYQLYKDMTPRQILRVLTSGESVRYSLVVPEGSNIFEIQEFLNHLWPGRGDDFLKYVTNPANVRKITGKNMSSMEGYLFPDTYEITKYTPMAVLVREMYDHFEQTIKQVDVNEKVAMSISEQVILASMIEKETGAPNERALISSVFHNRLNKHMRLQSDPTIIYGLWLKNGKRPFDITRADISNVTAYNTYRIPALPPGPIANPGRKALWAAVNPASTHYLYFVSRNDGTHVFSTTFSEHLRAVRKYQLNPRERIGKSWRDLTKKLEIKKRKNAS